MWKLLWIIRVVAGILLLLAWLGKFGGMPGNIDFVWGAAGKLIPFLEVLPNNVWFRVATLGEILAGAALILGYKTKLAGIVWAIIMLFAWNATGWGMDPKLLTILIGSLLTVFMGPGDFSLDKMLWGALGKATWAVGSVAWGIGDVAKGAANAAGSVASGAVDAAGSVAKGATNAAGSAVKGVGDAAWSVAGWAVDAVKGAGWLAGDLVGWVGDLAGWAIDKAGDMAKWVVTQVADKVDAATGWVASGVIDKVEDMAGDMIEKAEDMVEDAIDGDK